MKRKAKHLLIQTNGLSHIALRVRDLARSKQFYSETLGFPVALEVGDIVLVNANGLLLAMRGDNTQTAKDDTFNPFRVGIDHLALAVSDPAELGGLQKQLDAAGVRNNGVEDDATTGGRYIAFTIPTGSRGSCITCHPRNGGPSQAARGLDCALYVCAGNQGHLFIENSGKPFILLDMRFAAWTGRLRSTPDSFSG